MNKKHNILSIYTSLKLPLFLFFMCSTAKLVIPDSITERLAISVCPLVKCGQGDCIDTDSFPFFECNCYSGWIKPKFGNFTFPTCIIPNCTLDFECGLTGCSPSPHPPPPPPPPINTSIPCSLTWCGSDGVCEADGALLYKCECNPGSYNLLNNTLLPCLKKCALTADCHDLSLGFPPSNTNLSDDLVAAACNAPPTNGSNGGPGHIPALLLLLPATLFLFGILFEAD